MSSRQTYENYFREYYKTPKGRAAVRRAKKKYKQKLAREYGLSQEKARLYRKQYLAWLKEVQ